MEPHAFWLRVLAVLAEEGFEIPPRSTPAQVAARWRSGRGDDRLDRLVWGYCYPAIYGEGVATLTAQEAESLLEALRTARPPGSTTAPSALDGPSVERPIGRCALCRRTV